MNEMAKPTSGWLSKALSPRAISPQKPDDTQAPAPHRISRRTFLKGTAAAALVGGTKFFYDKSQPYNFALLKMDTNTNELGLEHRQCRAGDDDFSIEPTKQTGSDYIITDADMLQKDGTECLVISPELFVKTQDNGGQNADQKPIALKNSTHNLYIPYHFIENARSFHVSVGTNSDGEKKLRINIRGVSQVRQVPLLTAAKNAAVAAGKGVTGWLSDATQNMAARVDDFADNLGMGDGIDSLTAAQERQANAAKIEEQGRAHPTAEAHFEIEMDYNPEIIPNLIFYNGHRLDNPTFCVKTATIAKELTPNATEAAHKNEMVPGFELFPQRGVSLKDGVWQPNYIDPQYRYFDKELAKRAHAAQKLTSGPENGILLNLWNKIKEGAVHDDALNDYEVGALAMAARQRQAVLNEIGGGSIDGPAYKLAIRMGLSAQDPSRVSGQIPTR